VNTTSCRGGEPGFTFSAPIPLLTMLRVRTKGNGSSAPISKAIRLAFKHPSVKRKSSAYIEMSVTVRSRWVLEDVRCASLE
jgi:hypothetical protein